MSRANNLVGRAILNMTDSGLSTRLRQQSRRSGLMVGITMVLAIAICIFGAAALFAALARPFSDLIPIVLPAQEVPSNEQPSDSPTVAPESEQVIQPEVAATEAPAAEASVVATEAAFAPTHQVTALTSVNFRSGPSVNDAVIIALSPATPLQFLDEQETADDGQSWMKFRNESGQEGWISEDLVGPYQP